MKEIVFLTEKDRISRQNNEIFCYTYDALDYHYDIELLSVKLNCVDMFFLPKVLFIGLFQRIIQKQKWKVITENLNLWNKNENINLSEIKTTINTIISKSLLDANKNFEIKFYNVTSVDEYVKENFVNLL